MKGKAKIVSTLIALSLALTACGGGATNTTGGDEAQNSTVSKPESVERVKAPSGSKPSWTSDNSEFKIDWYVNLSWWKWNGDYGTDLVSKLIKEKTGATFNFIIPATDGGEQLSTMIASNSLPDVITLESWNDMKSKLAQGGKVWAMNDLINQYAPTFWDSVRDDVFSWFAEKDGKTYGFPNYAYSNKDVDAKEKLEPNGCIVVREDLYNAIGKPDMSTPENFLAACEKVKNEIKTYEGKQITPLQLYEFSSTGNTSALWLSQYFATPYEDEKGNYIYDITNSRYYDSLKFMNDAYRRNLINESNFSDTRDMINEKIARGSVFALISAPQDFSGAMLSLYEKDKKAKYIPVTLKNYDGKDPVLQDIRGFGFMFSMISKNAKQPDRIIKLFEYLSSEEGQMDTHFGTEGVTYKWNADKTKLQWTDEYLKAVKDGSSAKFGLSAMNLLANYASVMKIEPNPLTDGDKYIKDLKKPMEKYSYDFSAKFLKPDSTDPRKNKISDKSTKLDYYWGKQLPKIIAAPSEQEAKSIYDSTIEEMKNKGLDEVIQYRNDAFQNAKKELGLKFSWPEYNK